MSAADPTPGARPPAPVLFAHTGRNWIRGSERCLLDLVAGLDRQRFRPVVWCDAPALADAARALGAEVCLSPESWLPAGEERFPSRRHRREARELIRRHGIRLVHANATIPLKWLLPAARAARVPVLVHLHLPTSFAERCLSGAHQVALAVGVSHASAQGFLDDGMPPARVRVIYNGVDAERISRGDATALRAELGIAPDDVVVTAVGSLIPRKGIDVLLAAVARLRERTPGVRLLLVGDGPEGARLRELARSLGLAGVAHFLGEREDAGAILRDATDVAASPSRAETFGLAVVEASFFGRPVVASAIDAYRESVLDGETGLLVPPDDPAALAGALDALVRDPARRRRLGEAGRARARREFLVEHYVSRFEGAYEELLGRPARVYGWLGEWVWPSAYRHWLLDAVARRLPGRRRRPAGPEPVAAGGEAY